MSDELKQRIALLEVKIDAAWTGVANASTYAATAQRNVERIEYELHELRTQVGEIHDMLTVAMRMLAKIDNGRDENAV